MKFHIAILVILIFWGVVGILLFSSGHIPFSTIHYKALENTDRNQEEAPERTSNIGEIDIGASILGRVEVLDVKSKKTLLGWIPYWDQDKAFSIFKENIELFDYISLFWFRVDQNGKLTTYNGAKLDTEIISFAHENNVKVLVVVANLPDYFEEGSWDYRRVDKIIKTSAARTAHIEDLVELTLQYNFDGINIDYEALIGRQRDDFTSFIKELSLALHKENKILGVALHPKTAENRPEERNGSEAQDWEAIYPFVDQMYFMTYGEHYTESHPGPISSILWARSVLEFAINNNNVPIQKIFFGIPVYAQEWKRTGDNRYTADEVDFPHKKIIEEIEAHNATVLFDELAKSPYYFFSDSNGTFEVWFENLESFKEKFRLSEELGINNLAFWRLGLEDARIWDYLKEVMQVE